MLDGSMKRLSVVIPTLNERSNVVDCVTSARGLAAGAEGVEVEVVVSDGGSDDGTADLAAEAGATVVSGEPGRGRQLRAGVAASSGDVVLMLHADTRLPPEAGAQLAASLANPRVGAGAFRQRIDAPGALYRWLEAGNAFRACRFGLPYGDQAIFVRRELLDAVGGVPDLPLMEDVALLQRVRWRAWPVLLPGPLTVSARRWRRSGVVRQTALNWSLLAAFTVGVPAGRLAAWYNGERRHRSSE